MNDFCFIHAADLHLDSPFRMMRGAPDTIRKVLQQSTFAAFDNLVRLCVQEQVQFLLIAGDVYDLADRSLRAQMRFQQGMMVLAEHGIPVFVIHGNHDPEDGVRMRLDWPSNVHFFPADRVTSVPVKMNGQEIARIHGISYATAAVTTNFARQFHRESRSFAIGLLHANVGDRPGHANYMPCTLQDLLSRDFDYWALGHVHSRQVIHPSPPVVYPGNTQGRNIRETGAHGCYLVRVSHRVPDLEFHALDTVRWMQSEIDLTGVESEQELLHRLDNERETLRRLADGRPVVARIRLYGRTPLHRWLSSDETVQQLTEKLQDEEYERADFVWVETVEPRTGTDVDKEALLRSESILGDFLRMVREWKQHLSSPGGNADDGTPPFGSLPAGGRDGRIGIDLHHALRPLFGNLRAKKYLDGLIPSDEWDALLEEIEEMGIDLLTGEERL